MQKNQENNLNFSLTKIEKPTKNTTFKYTILNAGEHEQKLLFNTSQKYEYVISSKEEDFIQRYSDGRMFLQVLQEVSIPPKKELSYDITLPLLEEGTYDLTIYSVATNIDNAKKTIELMIKN